MKKRIISLLLSIILCMTMIPAVAAEAAGKGTDNSDYAKAELLAQEQTFSDWALNDLVVGDTYGIYPLSWYEKDMTAPVRMGQMIVLMARIRCKLIYTDCVITNTQLVTDIPMNMTVQEVLETFYTFLSGYEFTVDIGTKGKTAVEFMKDNGIYGTVEGEAALTDVCSVEQACVIGTRLVTYLFDKLDAASKGFFWVTKSGGNTVYMLGSIHLASYDIYPLGNKILDAFKSSDALAVELNMYDQTGAAKIAQKGMYTDGTTLKDHVSVETYKKTIELAAGFGYPETIIAMLKPWYIYSLFAALSNTDSGSMSDAAQAASLGIDLNFTTNAYLSGKQILEIEGYEYQANVLDSFSDELEEFLLVSVIDAVNDILAGKGGEDADYLDEVLMQWHNGDTESYKKYSSLEYEYPEIYTDESAAAQKALIDEFVEKLITQRDKRMADYIDSLLKTEGSNTYFIVVGSSHYISDYSVLDILNEKGYEITQIK